MSIFTPSHDAAEKIRELVVSAPAGGIFSDAQNGKRISPVETHGIINGPSYFYVEVPGPGGARRLMVTVQDVTADR